MRILIWAALFFSVVNSVAFAKLGGFEPSDGYIDVGDFGGTGRDFNVAHYNAGLYNEATTPLNYTSQSNGAGPWVRLQGPVSGNNSAYATSHRAAGSVMPHSGARALVVTTNTNGWAGNSQIYSYEIDSQDLGGLNPALTSGKTISMSFWVCSEIFGSSTPGGGLGPNTRGNYISFLDGSGNTGLQIGYYQPGTTNDYPAFRFGAAGAWTDNLTLQVDPHGWHRWDITIDLAAQKASIDYFDIVHSATPINFATSVPIGPMSDLREIIFESTPGVSNQKFFAVDDFGFVVPEPATFALLIFGMVVATSQIRSPRSASC